MKGACMASTLTPDQKLLFELAARVPLEEIPTARRLLQSLIVDPVWLSCATAPPDDEPLTPEDQAAIEQAHKDRAEGRTYSLDQVRQELDPPLSVTEPRL
jgi:hypothetical protein